LNEISSGCNRIHFEDEDGRRVISVGKVLSYETIRPAGVESCVYRCQSIIDDMETIFELKYRVKEHRWELYKM
jgi:hypothetical protein